MSDIPLIKLSIFRDEWNKEENYLYFEWEGSSLVVDKPHKHDFYMILLLQTSGGVHSIDFVPHPASGWQIHFLFPGQVHHWTFATDTIAQHFKKNATAVIRERIIIEARRQLALPDRSIKEVAFDLGFRDLANFSKFFKANTNYSPRAFRDMYNNGKE